MQLKTICAFAIGLSAFALFAQIVEPPSSNAPAKETAIDVITAKKQEASACCEFLRNLTKTPMPVESAEIKLDDTANIYDFGNGPQAYILFELPTYVKPYHLNISNIPQAPGLFNKTAYSQIALRLETFDTEFNSKRLYKHVEMKKRGLGFDKTVFINPVNASEKYLLIYGDMKASPEESTISERAPTMTGISSGLALSVLVAVASGGRVFLANPIVTDGVDRKVEITANDKGIILFEAKGLKQN